MEGTKTFMNLTGSLLDVSDKGYF